MSNQSRNPGQVTQNQGLYLGLLIFTASMLATALVVVHDNSTRTFSIFIFLLFFGVGIMLILGLVRGVLVSLFLISIWIYFKQLLGVWDTARLLDQMMELLLAGLTFIFAGRYHDQYFLRRGSTPDFALMIPCGNSADEPTFRELFRMEPFSSTWNWMSQYGNMMRL